MSRRSSSSSSRRVYVGGAIPQPPPVETIDVTPLIQRLVALLPDENSQSINQRLDTLREVTNSRLISYLAQNPPSNAVALVALITLARRANSGQM